MGERQLFRRSITAFPNLATILWRVFQIARHFVERNNKETIQQKKYLMSRFRIQKPYVGSEIQLTETKL